MLQAEDISLKDLKYLLAVAEHRSFVKAAESLSVSQPALSQQIKRLENHIGVQVFERSKRQFFITDIGQQILDQAQIILDESASLLAMSQANKTPLSGPLSVGIIASACAYLLPYFMVSLSKAYPNLKLSIHEGLTDQLLDELKSGQLDAMIAATTFDEPQLSSIDLYFEPFVIAYNPAFGDKLNNTVDASHIDHDRLLLLADGHCLKDQTLGICSIAESNVKNTYRATSIETLIQMVSVGVGTAILPLLTVESDLRFKKKLKFSKFKNKKDGRTMALFFRNTTHLKKEYQLLANEIKGSLEKTLKIL